MNPVDVVVVIFFGVSLLAATDETLHHWLRLRNNKVAFYELFFGNVFPPAFVLSSPCTNRIVSRFKISGTLVPSDP